MLACFILPLGATFCPIRAYFLGDEAPDSRCWWSSSSRSVAYGGYRVRQADAPYEWSGTVEARTIEVGSRVGGRVEQVHVREGDTVTAGQPLITLEKGDLPAQRLIAAGPAGPGRGRAGEGREPHAADRAPRARSPRRRPALQAQQARSRRPSSTTSALRKLFAGGAGTRVDADNATLALRNARRAGWRRCGRSWTSLLHGTPQDVRRRRAWSRPRAGACSRST